MILSRGPDCDCFATFLQGADDDNGLAPTR